MAKKQHNKSGRHTRKAKANRLMTVEGLHSIFEAIDRRVRAQIERGATDTELARCVRDCWREYFHRDLSGPAVEGMVRHYRTIYKERRRARTTRKQRGGMAPLDYTMGQGTTAPVYGRFPVEIGTSPEAIKSLDRFFESPIGRSCDSTGGAPAPPQEGGKRHRRLTQRAQQRGAGFFDSLFQPHAPGSVPRNIVETSLSAIQGAPIRNPPASPITYTPTLRSAPAPIYDPQSITTMTSLAPVYQGY